MLIVIWGGLLGRLLIIILFVEKENDRKLKIEKVNLNKIVVI